MLLPQSFQYPNLSVGADSTGGQVCGDKECPFSGVTVLAEFEGRCQKAMLGVWTSRALTFQRHEFEHMSRSLIKAV